MSEPKAGVILNRQKLVIAEGELVQHEGTIYQITGVPDLNKVIVKSTENGRAALLKIEDLKPVCGAPEEVQKIAARDLADLGSKEMGLIDLRFDAIEPLIHGRRHRKDVEARALKFGVDVSTIYRWLKRYAGLENRLALLRRKPGPVLGTKRLNPMVENIISTVIKDVCLSSEAPSDAHVAREIRRRCADSGLPLPHPNTISMRISEISEKERLIGRGMRERARNKFTPVPGSFPNADYPLAVVQIDHTPVDLILVDEEHRLPVTRPYITVAIDVFSRMIVGYYLSFDPPSETSVAMCVAHAILPKDEWLILHGVEASWPACGFMTTIHTDNGAEFRSETFRTACAAHGINLEYRPVKQPRYGGHIERLLGTLLKEIHTLPGTTFSNIKQRGEYDSEKHASMTMAEFEKWFVTFICKVYHQQKHSGIGMSPTKKWEIGVLGNGLLPGHGLPKLPSDRMALLLDFLPSFKRTIQADGVWIEARNYYSDVLRTWINSADPNDPDEKRKFTFRRDPRDISKVWFFDPHEQMYFEVPFANQALPPMSIWEYRRLREDLRKKGVDANDSNLMQARTEMRDQVEAAKRRSKKARRINERSKQHQKAQTPAIPIPPAQPIEPQSSFVGLVDGTVLPFDEE